MGTFVYSLFFSPFGVARSYPLHFRVDMNGERHSWQAIVLIPFVDMTLLQACTSRVALTREEQSRNIVCAHELFVGATVADTLVRLPQ